MTLNQEAAIGWWMGIPLVIPCEDRILKSPPPRELQARDENKGIRAEQSPEADGGRHTGFSRFNANTAAAAA